MGGREGEGARGPRGAGVRGPECQARGTAQRVAPCLWKGVGGGERRRPGGWKRGRSRRRDGKAHGAVGIQREGRFRGGGGEFGWLPKSLCPPDKAQ